jgi:predicted nucleic acid-binding protein
LAASNLVDTGFLVALLIERDLYSDWAVAQARRFPPPWKTCEAVLTESFHLLRANGPLLASMLRRGAVICPFRLDETTDEVLALMQKYADVPMSFADACIVRMTEMLSDPMLLTTDTDFHIYRRHSRQAVPCITPGD